MVKWIFLFFACFLLCTDAAATVFTVIPSDKSQSYLGAVLGGSVGTIYLGGPANPTLGLMFQRFNFIVVAVGVVVLSYIGIVSTINTAREGEAMGKKMSMWVPLRALFGMLMMVPATAAGYSVIQMTILWIVLNGIGAANAIWNVVLGQVQSGSAAVGAAVKLPNSLIDSNGNISSTALNSLSEQVISASTCMAALNGMSAQLSQMPNSPFSAGTGVNVNVDPINPPTIAPENSQNPVTIQQGTTINVGIQGGPYNNICGSIDISTSLSCDWKTKDGQLQPNNCQGFNLSNLSQRLSIKVNAVLTMFNAVQNAAITLAKGSDSGLTKGYVLAAGQAYASQITNMLSLTAGPGTGSASWEQGTNTGDDLSEIKGQGWIHAGSYYAKLVKAPIPTKDAETQESAIPTFADIPQPGQLVQGKPQASQGWNNWLVTQLSPTQIASFNGALTAAQNWNNKDTVKLLPTPAIFGPAQVNTGNSIANRVFNAVFYPVRQAATSFINDLTSSAPNKDPLTSMASHGTDLMSKAETGLFALFVATAGISLILSWNGCVSALAWTAANVLFRVGTFIASFLILFWGAGALLGIWVPLIPFLVFAAAAIGWIIAVIEAIVGAPIIALALIQPGGEELGKMEPGLLIIANIFLRPTLMIFGFVIAASFLRAALTMVNFGFGKAISPPTSLISNPTSFSFVALLVTYAMFVIGVTNKAFSLIYILPDRILRWLGHGGETTEPGEMMQKAEKGFETGKGFTETGLKGGLDVAGEAGKKLAAKGRGGGGQGQVPA